MSIEFKKEESHVLLIYTPDADYNYIQDIKSKLNDGKEFLLKRTFHLMLEHLIENDDGPEEPLIFKVADRQGDYYEFDCNILGVDFSLFIHEDVNITRNFFISHRVSIFPNINKLNPPKSIYIGGSVEKNKDILFIPQKDFAKILKAFPTDREKAHYARARMQSIFGNYVDFGEDAEGRYHAYMDKKAKKSSFVVKKGINFRTEYKKYEIKKFSHIKETMNLMLAEENNYSETEWQSTILSMIQLIFPKYIQALEEVAVKDKKRIDILLVSGSGYIDIIEIKKPFSNSAMGRTPYRGNYIPRRELVGSIIQAEKYLFLLNQWGKKGEDTLNEKYKSQLPENLRIKTANPSAIIIMGRDNNLSEEQKRDFEILKRQYKNIVDIITYDDLLRRITFIIKQLERS